MSGVGGKRGIIFFLVYFTFQAISRHFEIFFEKNRRTLLGDQLLCYSESQSSGRGQNAVTIHSLINEHPGINVHPLNKGCTFIRETTT